MTSGRVCRRHLTRGLVAAGLALVLLGGSAATYARWSDQVELPGTTIEAGGLGMSIGNPVVKVSHTDFVPGATSTSQLQRVTTDVTGAPIIQSLMVGDVVSVDTPITITATGNTLSATLTVDPGAPIDGSPLETELLSQGTVQVTSVNGTALTRIAPTSWTVTPAHHGGQYVLTVSFGVRETTNGLPRDTSGSMQNWWGGQLQGAQLSARQLGISLTQNAVTP